MRIALISLSLSLIGCDAIHQGLTGAGAALPDALGRVAANPTPLGLAEALIYLGGAFATAAAGYGGYKVYKSRK